MVHECSVNCLKECEHSISHTPKLCVTPSVRCLALNSHTHIHTHTHARTNTHTRTHKHAQTHTDKVTNTQTRTNTNTHTYFEGAEQQVVVLVALVWAVARVQVVASGYAVGWEVWFASEERQKRPERGGRGNSPERPKGERRERRRAGNGGFYA